MYHRLLQISTSAESFQQNLIGKYKENQKGDKQRGAAQQLHPPAGRTARRLAPLLSPSGETNTTSRLPGGQPGDWRHYYRRQAKQTLPPACRADSPAIGAKQAAQFQNLRGCNRHDDRAMMTPGSRGEVNFCSRVSLNFPSWRARGRAARLLLTSRCLR